ncbi:MAG: tetratricopeptide repeat protein [Pseudomonadota bacterium]
MRHIISIPPMIAATLALAVFLAPGPARAVFSGDMSPRAESGDKDYAEAIRARKAKNWMGMVNSLLRVVDRRPWHDNAHNLLGYGYRKMKVYDLALKHYHIALELNPRHRQALEYLGEAYLQIGDMPKAEATLARLGEVCTGVALTFSDGDFTDGCDEYRELHAAMAYYRIHGEVPPDQNEEAAQ